MEGLVVVTTETWCWRFPCVLIFCLLWLVQRVNESRAGLVLICLRTIGNNSRFQTFKQSNMLVCYLIGQRETVMHLLELSDTSCRPGQSVCPLGVFVHPQLSNYCGAVWWELWYACGSMKMPQLITPAVFVFPKLVRCNPSTVFGFVYLFVVKHIPSKRSFH